MAKRIMLSIIPTVMNKTERFHTGGFDYKALKAAAEGAKDLVKYGTEACLDELGYYMTYRRGAADAFSEETIDRMKIRQDAINSFKQKNYKTCLMLCTKAFRDPGGWEPQYGGPPWAKISDTLYKLADKTDLLRDIRIKMKEKDKENDWLDLEVDVMKEIIVLMNIFDGLAHNTGSIMPKVVYNELKDIGKNLDYKKRDEYEDKVRDLMDSKELENTYSVYKTVKDIIEAPENKYYFKDYIDRIKLDPEYKKAPTQQESKDELEAIATKKKIISIIQRITLEIDEISEIKDKYLNKEEELYSLAYESAVIIVSKIKDIVYIINDATRFQLSSPKYKNKFNNFLQFYYQYSNVASNMYYNLTGAVKHHDDYPLSTFLSEFHKLKQQTSILEERVKEL